MIGYAMVGTTNLERTTLFYDALLAPLGLARFKANETYTAYASTTAPDAIEFYVTKPFDGAPATAGNGSMLAFLVQHAMCLNCFTRLVWQMVVGMRGHRAHGQVTQRSIMLISEILMATRYARIANTFIEP